MHLPSFVRDRSFYANFYCRNPSEIEIIDKISSSSSSSYALRISSETSTVTTPLSDASSIIVTSGFLSSSECSSSESTTSYTKRRRTTAPIIQERLNTYESACIRPSLPLSSLASNKQKTQSSSTISTPSLVNKASNQEIIVEQTPSLLTNTSNLIDTDTSKTFIPIERNSSTLNSTIDEQSVTLDSCKKYLSKSTSQLCERSLNNVKEEEIPSSSRSILDVIQEELVSKEQQTI